MGEQLERTKAALPMYENYVKQARQVLDGAATGSARILAEDELQRAQTRLENCKGEIATLKASLA